MLLWIEQNCQMEKIDLSSALFEKNRCGESKKHQPNLQPVRDDELTKETGRRMCCYGSLESFNGEKRFVSTYKKHFVNNTLPVLCRKPQ